MRQRSAILIVTIVFLAIHTPCGGEEPNGKGNFIIPFKYLLPGPGTTLSFDITRYFNGTTPDGFNTDKPLNAKGIVEVISGKEKVVLSQPEGHYESKMAVLITFKKCTTLEHEKISEREPPNPAAAKLLAACKEKGIVVSIRERAAPPRKRDLEWVIKRSGTVDPSEKE